MNHELKKVTRARTLDQTAVYDNTNDTPPILLPGALADLHASRRAYLSVLRVQKQKEFEGLISDMDTATHLGDRVQMAFRFLKPVRRSPNSSSARISIRDWHHDLQKAQGESVPLIAETDNFPLVRLPSVGDVSNVLMRMKNGKSPGLYLLAVEMLKPSPTLAYALHHIICSVYHTRQVPISWQTTVSHPIPKKQKPTGIGDDRKIIFCSIGYKIHASLLLQLIKPFLPTIDDYQSGFLPGRSCDLINL